MFSCLQLLQACLQQLHDGERTEGTDNPNVVWNPAKECKTHLFVRTVTNLLLGQRPSLNLRLAAGLHHPNQ